MDKHAIDEKILAEAKEKLACHILPPGAHADADAQASPWQKAMSEAAKEADPSGDSCGSSGSQADFMDENGNVFLTRMTTAGG